MKRRVAALLAAVSIVLATVLSMAASAIASPTFSEGRQRPAFLGYEIGEERRYVLGPPQDLLAGEDGRWSIYLRELLGDPAEGIFELAHEWHRGDTGTEVPLGTITEIKSRGELRVNGHGFPLAVSFRTERHLAGMGDEVYLIDYRYENDRFRKQIAAQGTETSHTVTTRGHRYLDRSVPSGMYAFVPTAVDCSTVGPTDSRRNALVRPPRRTAGVPAGPSPPTTPTRYADNRRCRESLFANPGLLGLMMPALREEGTGERGFLLFTPTGASAMPGLTVGGGALGAGTVVGGGGAGFDSASRPDSNSEVERLRYIERATVEVGPRTREAWVFDRIGEFSAVYVDDEDVVLRVDISDVWARGLSSAGSFGADPRAAPAGVAYDGTAMRPRRLHVRLLFPSEY